VELKKKELANKKVKKRIGRPIMYKAFLDKKTDKDDDKNKRDKTKEEYERHFKE
jgi:hypothetical protein